MNYENFLGRCETVHDWVDASFLADAAAVLDVALPADGSMPPLWHWMMFKTWARPAALRADGGAVGEGFLPPFQHLPRRLAAGGRLEFRRPLRVGEAVQRTSRIHRIQDKEGRTGPLVLLTILRTFTVGDEVVLQEEQDVVYMQEGAPVARPDAAAPVAAPEVPAHALVRSCKGDPLTLFRYSALTANSHRIHYDLEYARGVEGFAGLVVHGPLQATWLAALASSIDPTKRIVSMEFRNLGAAYHTDDLLAAAWDDKGAVRLDLRKGGAAPCMTGTVTLG
ncbi:MaoC family dehydratase N-terminal domain-containing protein [Ramlibacter sp. AN1015]|uniref:FAS1-like dehydratase domain-containing protein n=1 Tax=Ramlibacter sp. AN1015 TaxID=3133428 RepID=UPI0030C5B332